MRISRNDESSGRPLSTADLAAAGRHSDAAAEEGGRQGEYTSESGSEAELARSETPPAAVGRKSAGEQANMTRANEPMAKEATPKEATPKEATPRETAPREAAPKDAAKAEALVALFTPELTETYRSRWISIQSSFVDDPRQAVRNGDELVAQVMTNLANSFADERHRVEGQLDETGEGSTENLRVALRRYRSFFERLLSL